jgi:hypothetical protein
MRRLLRSAAPAAAALLLATTASNLRAAEVPGADETAVRVQRVKPDHPRLATLRFLGTNRDYLRAELDRLRVKSVQLHGDADAIDPRFLRYGEMVAEARAAGDSAAVADSARAGRELFASVTDLGVLETELDQMDRALAGQRDRLAILQADFAGDQRTALAVVLSGWPGDGAPASLTLSLEDGTQEAITLTPAQLDALRAGGVVQVLHRLIEPREQAFAVAFGAASAPGWLELDPARDRLNLLRLDLSRLAGGDAASLAATTWILDDRTP